MAKTKYMLLHCKKIIGPRGCVSYNARDTHKNLKVLVSMSCPLWKKALVGMVTPSSVIISSLVGACLGVSTWNPKAIFLSHANDSNWPLAIAMDGALQLPWLIMKCGVGLALGAVIGGMVGTRYLSPLLKKKLKMN